MKKASIFMLILVLTAMLFAGCRNNGTNTTNSTVPTSSNTTTVLPLPEVTKSTAPTASTDPSTTTMPGRSAARPSAKGPRY